ncbi:MAG: methyltransferase domain-containing protein [Planctomycetota bacterium]
MSRIDDYILGTDEAEAKRLEFQHRTWLAHAQSAWQRASISPGDTVLDLGCGPGFTTFELARVVTAAGKVVARDLSQRFLDAIDRRCAGEGITHVETSCGPAEELELAEHSLDAAYARWLFCWLEDPRSALSRVTHALKPGGRFVIQDYIDWGTMSLLPPSSAFDRAVKGCMDSFAAAGGDIDVGKRLPALAREIGLEVVHVEPIARIGAVGSDEWRWIGAFLRDYVPKIVGEGRLSETDAREFAGEWQRRTESSDGHLVAPTMLDLILRKP